MASAIHLQPHLAPARRGAGKRPREVAPPRAEGGLSVGYLLGRARASLLSGLDAELAPFGLNAMQYAVLKHLAEGAARTAADLCRFMYYDTGSMTRILDRLEEKGLLRRERSPDDRRVVLLRVAAAGRAQLPRLRAVGSRVLADHLAGFRSAEVVTLKRLLGRMIDNGTPHGGQEPHARRGGKP
jgi:MarR family transcriptional regulator, multiple antibiotic resistance protein MarR